MKPYGVRNVGPICEWGCCWVQNCRSGFKRRLGHGAQPYRKRARRAAKRELRTAVKERA